MAKRQSSTEPPKKCAQAIKVSGRLLHNYMADICGNAPMAVPTLGHLAFEARSTTKQSTIQGWKKCQHRQIKPVFIGGKALIAMALRPVVKALATARQ